jgi:hypothetical protein
MLFNLERISISKFVVGNRNLYIRNELFQKAFEKQYNISCLGVNLQLWRSSCCCISSNTVL